MRPGDRSDGDGSEFGFVWDQGRQGAHAPDRLLHRGKTCVSLPVRRFHAESLAGTLVPCPHRCIGHDLQAGCTSGVSMGSIICSVGLQLTDFAPCDDCLLVVIAFAILCYFPGNRSRRFGGALRTLRGRCPWLRHLNSGACSMLEQVQVSVVLSVCLAELAFFEEPCLSSSVLPCRRLDSASCDMGLGRAFFAGVGPVFACFQSRGVLPP